MTDLETRLESLRRHVEVGWTEARAGEIEAALLRRGARQARTRRVLVLAGPALGLILVLGGVGWAGLERYRHPVAVPALAPTLLVPAPSDVRVAVPPSTPAAAPAPEETAQPAPAVRPAPQPAASWRRLANDGDFDDAFRSLKAAGPSAVKDDTGDLLLASDVARLSGHASDAVDPLRRVMRDHASDPRAPLGAFTLGRVLLDELGRPAEAATAFARARSLAPGGPLEEDALAREVEAWSRAGDTNKAREAADLYLATFPSGRRLHSVRRFGGLE